MTYLHNGLILIEGVGIIGVDTNTGTQYSGLVNMFINVSGLFLSDLECYSFEGVDDQLISILSYGPISVSEDCIVPYDVLMSSERKLGNNIYYFLQKGNSVYSHQKIDKVSIYNSLGSLILQTETKKGELISNNLTPGIYVFAAEVNGKIYAQKILIK